MNGLSCWASSDPALRGDMVLVFEYNGRTGRIEMLVYLLDLKRLMWFRAEANDGTEEQMIAIFSSSMLLTVLWSASSN